MRSTCTCVDGLGARARGGGAGAYGGGGGGGGEMTRALKHGGRQPMMHDIRTA